MSGIILLMHSVLWVLRIGRVGFAWVLIVLVGVRGWRVVVWLVMWLERKLQFSPENARALVCILMTYLPSWCLIEVLHLFLIIVLIVHLIHYVSPSRLVN
jgi:hypothetical protein